MLWSRRADYAQNRLAMERGGMPGSGPLWNPRYNKVGMKPLEKKETRLNYGIDIQERGNSEKVNLFLF